MDKIVEIEVRLKSVDEALDNAIVDAVIRRVNSGDQRLISALRYALETK